MKTSVINIYVNEVLINEVNQVLDFIQRQYSVIVIRSEITIWN